ncbi:hypothetical protein LC048_00160 [Mesobacillus subterraneus]|uniref:hypothetical protein n=1 Tax=Mesobacillus subterraneus TaxID=285983 RepID=UPI001CFCB42B|nr:hypothetical protein [Mesobacillus subterraneus]WLR57808.1 hypothetical protein LC048_00160 [Mesobacillus subterraneus]
MAEIKYIRHEVNNKGCGYANVAKRMGKDPRTIKKYADLCERQVKMNNFADYF